jgi:hypothetical protein
MIRNQKAAGFQAPFQASTSSFHPVHFLVFWKQG